MSRTVRRGLSSTARQTQHGLVQGFKSLFVLSSVPRPLSLVALCSLCMALPLLAGVLTSQINIGLTACVGALLGLYSPSFSPGFRARALSKMALPFLAAFSLGLITQHHLVASSLSLVLVALIATYLALYKRMRPPAGFFFIMVCCLSKTHHVNDAEFPQMIAAFLGGSLFAICAVYLHDLVISKQQAAPQAPSTEPFWQKAMFIKAAMTALAVGGSYYLSSLAGIDNPYWVPITVAAILQGQRMADFWQRSLHRATGTAIGMLLATGIFAFSPSPLVLIVILFMLAFTIEILIAKNYALACIFITPLTVILAHTAPAGNSAEALIFTRMADVLIGTVFALTTGILLKMLSHKNR